MKEAEKKEFAFGMRKFFNLKYRKKECSFLSIPRVASNCFFLDKYVDDLVDSGRIIELEEFYFFNHLMVKYFREDRFEHNSFLVDEYYEKHRYYGLGSIVFSEYVNLEGNTNEIFINWIKRKFEHLKFHKPTSYFQNSIWTLRQIENITFAEFEEDDIRTLVHNHFQRYYQFIFARLSLHLSISENINFEVKKDSEELKETFSERNKSLFINPSDEEVCLKILKDLDPPLIDANCNFIGGPKGTVVIWVEELRRQGLVKSYTNRKIYASQVMKVIHRFTIDESMFGKPQKRAEAKYRTEIRTMVSQLKLSQNSQKGKLGK